MGRTCDEVEESRLEFGWCRGMSALIARDGGAPGVFALLSTPTGRSRRWWSGRRDSAPVRPTPPCRRRCAAPRRVDRVIRSRRLTLPTECASLLRGSD
jgi:hypothetical protein